MEDSYDMHSSTISDVNPEMSAIMDESCNSDRIFRYKFSQIQRQMLQQDMSDMKEKTDEMRGKDAKMRQKFLELQQKRRLLEIDLDGVPASMVSPISMSNYKNKRKTSPLAMKLPPTPPKSRALQNRRDVSQDESFLDLPLGGLAIDSRFIVPDSSTHGATVRDAAALPPVPPPRRQRGRVKERRSVGRAEPYRTPEKGLRSPRQPTQPMSSALSPRRYTTNRAPMGARCTATPAQELSQLACQLQSAKRTRAPDTPVQRYQSRRQLTTPEVQLDKMQLGQQVTSKPPTGPKLIKTHKSTGSLKLWSGLGSSRSQSSTISADASLSSNAANDFIDINKSTGSLKLWSGFGRRRSKSSTSTNSSVSCNVTNSSNMNKSTTSLTRWAGLGRRRSKSSTSANAGVSCNVTSDVDMSLVSGTSSSFNRSQSVTQWSLFDASLHSQKENKYNKAKREADSKPNRGMRKSKSGNKIVPVVTSV